MITTSNLYSLDSETASEKADLPYALEPYRKAQGLARITSVAVAGPDSYLKQVDERSGNMEHLKAVLEHLSGKYVVCHNAVFDVAWMIEQVGVDVVRKVKWLDTMLLAKWIHNGQELEKYKKKDDQDSLNLTLASLVRRYMVGHPMYEEFLDMKGQQVTPGENYDYWLQRGRMDAIITRDLFLKLIQILPEAQLNGYFLEQRAICPVAYSWVKGIHLDVEKTKALAPKIERAKKNIAAVVGKPEAMFSSPKQLSHFLFKELGLNPISKTPTGNPSTAADDLKLMAYRMAGTSAGKIIQHILDFKQVKTLESKFINGILRVANYNGEAINHSAPRMFSTYTGRFTYSSKTLNKEAFRPGIATHQLPRKGPTRSLLKAPPGMMVGELDAAAQELRGIGIVSRDEGLITGFNNGTDLHGSMGAFIAGEPYGSYMARYKAEEEDAVNFRYAGKLLNLSCQYRIGNKSLAAKFFSTYGIVVSDAKAAQYLSLYKRKYPGVVKYWDDAIRKAKLNGYAETIAGRRYIIDAWGGRNAWSSESSAINFPVQGFGGDHKVLAIAEIWENYPEALFMLDLHDGLWYGVPEDHGKELLLDMRDHLSNLPYGDIWNAEVPIPLLFDAQFGDSFGNIHEITR